MASGGIKIKHWGVKMLTNVFCLIDDFKVTNKC